MKQTDLEKLLADMSLKEKVQGHRCSGGRKRN